MDPWFPEQGAGWLGAVFGGFGGLFGTVLGAAGSVLVPKGRGRGLVFGTLGLGAAVGFGTGIAGVVALLRGQPYHVWYPFVMFGFLIGVMSVVFVPVMRARYRAAEERTMAMKDLE